MCRLIERLGKDMCRLIERLCKDMLHARRTINNLVNGRRRMIYEDISLNVPPLLHIQLHGQISNQDPPPSSILRPFIYLGDEGFELGATVLPLKSGLLSTEPCTSNPTLFFVAIFQIHIFF